MNESDKVIIAGWMRIVAEDEDAKADLAEHWREMGPVVRAEQGCLDYSISRDLNDPDLIRVLEVWDSQQAMDDHLARKGATPGADTVLMDFSRYYAGRVEYIGQYVDPKVQDS